MGPAEPRGDQQKGCQPNEGRALFVILFLFVVLHVFSHCVIYSMLLATSVLLARRLARRIIKATGLGARTNRTVLGPAYM